MSKYDPDKAKAYRDKNRKALRKQDRDRYWRDPEKPRAAAKRHARKLRQEVLEHYGGQPPCCACCGEMEPVFLTIDHLEGNGNQHRKQLGGAPYFYRWLKREGWPPGFQVLCWNCNRGRWANDGHCPHE